jgi:hypothetical protein
VEVALPDLDDAIPRLDLLGLGAAPAPIPDPREAATRASVFIAVDVVEGIRSAVRDALATLERDTSVPLHRPGHPLP